MIRKTLIKILVIAVFLIPLLLISSGVFYWFQVRPTKIKHECSWVKTHFDKVPAKPAKTEEEVFVESKLSKEDFERALGLARGEIKPRTGTAKGMSGLPVSFEDHRLSVFGDGFVKQMQESPEVPARDETRQAKDEEYRFCLRDKGL